MKIGVSVRIAATAIALLAGASPAALSAQEIVAPATPNADKLAQDMRVLASDPNNLDALISAGQLNVKLADPAAALQFFERAEKVSPKDPRIAAGRGSALVALERPGEALRQFALATQEGLDTDYYAADRGLAYDLLGHPALAQRDYRMEIAKHGESDELRRRLALSLGISGDVKESSALLEPLLRRQDKAAWRARAFILAMNGDVAGANKIASTMFPNFGPDFAPYFKELEGLSPSARAHAVHFGRLALGPEQLADARLAPALPADEALASNNRAEPPATERKAKRQKRKKAMPGRTPLPQSEVVAETPGTTMQGVASNSAPARTPTPTPIPAPAETVKAPPPETNVEIADTSRQAAPARTTARPAVIATQPAATPSQPVASTSAKTPAVTPTPTPKPSQPETRAAPPTVIATQKPVESSPARVETAPAPKHKPSSRIASIMANMSVPGSELGVAPVRSEPEPETEAAPNEAKKIEKSEPAKKAKPAPKPKPSPEKANPARHWVQVAGGANEDTLARTYARLVDDAPTLFKGKQPWTAKLRATNRILVGPFDSADAAQDFVNVLAKQKLSGFAWDSEPGEEVRKLKQP